MSVTPRLLRRASQRVLSSSISTGKETVCPKCRLLVTRQNLHTYRRRPTVVPGLGASVQLTQKRGFLDLFKAEWKSTFEKKVENKPQNPGIAVLAALTLYVDEKAGMAPTTSELIKAFKMIVFDEELPIILKDDGVCYGLLRCLETLSKRGDIDGVKSPALARLLESLHHLEHTTAVSLAGALLGYIRRVREHDRPLLRAGFEAVVATLANTYDFSKAMGFLTVGAETYGPKLITGKAWWHVLRKIIDKDDEEALLKLTELEGVRKPNNLGDVGVLTGAMRFYMDRDDTANARKWWDELKDSATSDTFKMIFGYAVGHPEDRAAKEWIEHLFEHTELVEPETPPKDEARLTAREELEVMKLKWKWSQGETIHTIAGLIPSISPKTKIELINELVDFAVWRKDATAAQVLLVLAERWRVEPNRRTQVLHIRVRLMLEDTDGAYEAWESLKYYRHAPDSDEETLELLRYMTSNIKTKADVIDSLYNETLKRKISLDVETLCGLSRWQIFNKPFNIIIATLSREINNYHPGDRMKVIMHLGELMGMKDPELGIGEMWNVYLAMRGLFPELPLSARKQIMELFFSRGASDVANVIFLHMRQTKHAKPDAEAYASAFRHCARLQDAQTLWSIHIQFKVDPEVTPTTELYNSLMYAYNSVNQPKNALDIFRTITNSKEGPNSDTLSLVMISCGLAKEMMASRSPLIWKNFLKLGFKPTSHNHAMRLSAWCLADKYDMAFKVLRELESKDGFRPNREIFMGLYAEYQPSRRPEIEKWAQENIPEVWREIVADPEEPLKKYEGQQDVWVKNAPDIFLG
ncbi:hypothetical protein AOL_s00083g339 [Orbilia oligospora ATCC 24927]|uniref:Complex I intermediate-associated protein 84, mitochondrial n=1 Tax=Arthrobotrys oligospora (strain ATCC 24927 / CBS 115.81 / DSM 1491) TaxID=756982 RepID=G1XH58_ARTOA|nr:hypothetical protein AOL_s00083g339 [Orbilia oligospora ATCC 24927]EGX47530.1 hypothetical protein AOL_s00083g339 [Orbilia oligospora ATCC 24927]